MNNHTRIYIDRDADRDTVVTVLSRNGYTVRQGREKVNSKYVKYVEYWTQKEEQA